MDNKSLRKTIRQRRRCLTAAQQKVASRGLLKQLKHTPLFWSAKSVGLYIAADGEIDPDLVAKQCWKLNKEVYLPVLDRFGYNRLMFVRWSPGDRLVKNRFGIPEPVKLKPAPAWRLSLVLLPLVAFDALGNRMGMGGGFYDRTFAFCKRSRLKPTMVGLAHELQRLDRLETQHWDIPLDAIVTDQQWYAQSAVHRVI